ITQENMGTYFAAGAGLVGIGSNLYDKAAFASRDTAALVAQITRTREAAHG
ncbi:MAG: bifunctional 4-hydroxy-2-oxoglutarate aldolase/2-dehydro-3-deoxy-phosphogluconate aldolase, partial [Achromobacter mucicolens]